MDTNIYWGDMHAQFQPSEHYGEGWDTYVENAFIEAREYVDFFPFVYYPAHMYRTPEGLRVETVGWRDYYAPDWQKIRALVRKYHEPGELVTFLGYEWTGDRTKWGDHNVFYFDEDNPLDLSMELPDLYDNLRERNGLAIPHHTGYMVGNRGKDWDCWDAEISPFGEIFSHHGSSEGCNTPFTMSRNGQMAPRVSAGSIQAGLARGYRLGIMASNDYAGGFVARWGTGLMAACAQELTRESLWEAFQARRVYGVTGDRIRVDYRANDTFMGGVITGGGPVTLRANVTGTQALDRIEVIRNNRVAYTHCHNGTWDIPDSGTVRVKLPFEVGWGPGGAYVHSSHEAYGLEVGPKDWSGRLEVSGGTLVSTEGCFTTGGNRIRRTADNACEFDLRTEERGFDATGNCQQTVVFEIEGDCSAEVTWEIDGHRHTQTLCELMNESRVYPDIESCEAMIQKLYGLSADDIENPDVLYHNAYKVKQHKAIPQAGYEAALEWTDEPGEGRNWYYLRISQLNNQYAWTSPVWVDN
ncbi:MAG: DUF3604 domain-containing protein [Armatimonadota bacterium]